MSSIRQITGACFNAATQLRRMGGESPVPVESLHQKMIGYIDDLWKQGKEEGLGEEEAEELAYALVAHLDEIALRKPGSIRDYWVNNLLQMHFFRENVAGDGFFVRLDRIRTRAKKKDKSRELLDVYYLCLLFGFEGRYRVNRNQAELSQLRESLSKELAQWKKKKLSPRGDRPPGTKAKVRRALPLLTFAIVVLAASLLYYGGLKLSIDMRGNDLREDLEAAEDEARSRAAKSERELRNAEERS